MAVIKTTYVIEVDDQTGKVKIQGLTRGFVKADSAAKKLNETLATTTKRTGQLADKTGLAGAAVVEIGRTISDSNFGMTAMANNLSQLSTLMMTLVATSGGLKNGIGLLLKAFQGPLGFIVLFQIAITLLERFAIKEREASVETKRLTSDLHAQTQILQTLGNFATGSSDALEALKRQFREVGEFLDAAESVGDLDPDIIDFAIARGRELLSARAEIRRITLLLTDAESELTEKQKENLRFDLVEQYEKESRALDALALKKQKVLELTNEEGEQNSSAREKQKKARILTAAERLEFEQEAENERLQVLANSAQEEASMFKALMDFKMALREEEAEHARIMTGSIIDGLFALGEIAGEETAAGKSLAVAGALIDTYAAIAGQLKAFSGVPIPGYAIAQAIATGLVGFAQVKQILSVKVPGGGGSGGGSSSGGPANVVRPNFNIVGTSNASELKGAVLNGLGDNPIKAYVTTKDINSADELDRNTRGGAVIG